MKKIFVIFYSLLYSITLFCQQNSNSLLWKISGNGLKNPSYIFGTIHIIPASDFYTHPAMDSLLSKSQSLVMEMDLSDPTLQLKLMSQMMLDSGRTLKSFYTAGEYKKMSDKASKTFGFSLDALASFRPIFAQQILVTRTMMGKETKSYEKYFLELAQKSVIKLVGLETVEDQMNALNSIPLERQAAMLKESILKYDKEKQELESMIRDYKAQKIDALYAYTTSKEKYKDFEEGLLVKRNKDWIPKIKNLIAEGTAFIAVGAAHLGGATGILELLRKEGFTVEAIQ
jgi:uncharacterized protein YbaP (TraB family)